MKIAIQHILVPGRDLQEKFASARRFGFDGVELTLGPAFDLNAPLREVEAAVKSSGMPVAALCSHSTHDPFVPDAALRKERFNGLSRFMQLAEELNAAGVVSVPVRPPHKFSDLDQNELMQLAISVYGEWANELPTGKSRLFLEPLNRYEATFLRRVEQAVHLARGINHPRVCALADLFHMNIEEAHMGKPLGDAGSMLGHVHIADNNRYQPGAGCMDFRVPLAALKTMGYSGYISLECWQPDGAIILGDPEIALPATIAHLKSAMGREVR